MGRLICHCEFPSHFHRMKKNHHKHPSIKNVFVEWNCQSFQPFHRKVKNIQALFRNICGNTKRLRRKVPLTKHPQSFLVKKVEKTSAAYARLHKKHIYISCSLVLDFSSFHTMYSRKFSRSLSCSHFLSITWIKITIRNQYWDIGLKKYIE